MSSAASPDYLKRSRVRVSYVEGAARCAWQQSMLFEIPTLEGKLFVPAEPAFEFWLPA